MPAETTIAISLETKKILDNKKIHPRQSYDEIIRKKFENGCDKNDNK